MQPRSTHHGTRAGVEGTMPTGESTCALTRSGHPPNFGKADCPEKGTRSPVTRPR